MQSKQPLPVLAGEMADLPEIMKSLTGTDAAPQAETDDKGGAAISVMNLLNGLRAIASERSKGVEFTPELQEQAASLLSELQKFTDQKGVLSSGLQESLRGMLNPAVQDREDQLTKLVAEAGVESSDEQNASEMTSALIASLNSLLPQAADGRKLASPAVKADSGIMLSGSTPVGMPDQSIPDNPTAMRQQEQQNLDAETVRTAVAEMTGEAVAKKQPIEAAVKEVNHVKPRSKSGSELKGSDAAALIDVRIQDEARQSANPEESLEMASTKLFAGEEPVNPEFNGAGQKGEQVANLKLEPFRADMVIPSQPEGKMPVSGAQSAAVDGRLAVSHEQIISQVKEKLAEQRISTDNGQVTLKLHPVELGELKITVRMDDQRVRVDVVAENRMVKDALMQNIDSLKEALARQNVSMERFDVSTGGRQLFDHGFREGQQQEQQFVSRGAAWLTGRNNDQAEIGTTQWKARDNALLDMMM
jgi:flagellar hook-length control protein FliK